MELFGFEILRKEKKLDSFVVKQYDDGAMTVAEGGSYGTYLDIEGSAKSEAELITKYRELSTQPELEYAIDEIVNEAVAFDERTPVKLITEDLKDYSKEFRKKIMAEFDNIVEMMDFNNVAYDLFRRWYVDGRCVFHVIIDEDNVQEGIKELRYVDPRKIRKVRELTKNNGSKFPIPQVKNEYYIYNEKGFDYTRNNPEKSYIIDHKVNGIKIADDSIIFAPSGLMNETNTMVLSYLHKAIRPMNQLRALEDAVVIYRITRAPERRIFYIDVGNLPKAKAEQYLRDMMVKHKNKNVYDSSTGEIRDDRRQMTMLEDYWLPRREGGRGTQIDTLPGGSNLGEMDDVNYFLQKLYKALNIPLTRIEQGQTFSIGRSSEISRDEVKFQKFINRLRTKFSHIFFAALEKQLILKNIISPEEWPDIKNKIYFDYAIDNHFTELKKIEILNNRLDIVERLNMMVGTYYSKEFIRRSILLQDDEEIDLMDQQIEQEMANNELAVINPSLIQPDMGMDGGMEPDEGDQNV